MSRLVHRLLAATLLGVAAGPAALSAPAHAAACTGGTGVTVVVGSSVGCDANGGGPAASNFADAGHQLRYASGAPGFVCRVDGAPASDPCVEASPVDAYWGLFWSDGKKGTWTYSSLGVTSLKVPQGGSVAFVFQDSSSRTWPSVKPPVAAPEPTRAPERTTTASPKPGSKDQGSKASTPKRSTPSTRAGSPASSAPSATASASAGATPSASTPTPSASASTATPSASAPAASAGTDDDVAGAPALQPAAAEGSGSTSGAALATAAAVVVVLAAAGGVVWYRRRAG